jgi:hypothetical protein
MKKTVLRFGLLAGAVMLVINFVPLILLEGDPHKYEWGEVLGYTGMVLGLTAVFFGIRHHRDHTLGGRITFGKALALGLMISAIAAALFCLMDTLYVTVINPDFATSYTTAEVARLEAAHAPPEQIQEVKDMGAMMKGASGVVFLQVIMFFTVFLIGLAISLISAFVLARANTTAVKP